MPMLNSYNNPYYYPTNYIPPQQVQTAAPVAQSQPQPQIQNGGFVSVRNETEARNYPVAPGNSVTFKDESTPYVLYTKTMGFSQFDRPVFEKYKLVKETVEEVSDLPENDPEKSEVNISTINELKHEIGAIWKEIDVLKERPVSAAKKSSTKKEKEVAENDAES